MEKWVVTLWLVPGSLRVTFVERELAVAMEQLAMLARSALTFGPAPTDLTLSSEGPDGTRTLFMDVRIHQTVPRPPRAR
jgi:hypothetical protein